MIGIIVTLFTQPERREFLAGLTFWIVEDGKRLFKGAEPNEKEGKSVVLRIKVEGEASTVSVAPNTMKLIIC